MVVSLDNLVSSTNHSPFSIQFLTQTRLDEICKDSDCLLLRSGRNMSPNHHHHRSLWCDHNLSYQPNLRRILLEPLRTPPSHPKSLPDSRRASWNLLRRPRLPLFPNRTLYRPQRYLNRNGHGSSLSALDKYPSRMLHPNSHCRGDLSLELREQCYDFYQCSFGMEYLFEWYDWDFDL